MHGSVEISGMKNSAVAIILANLLIEDICVIENVPNISDVTLCFDILRAMGVKIRMLGKNTYEIDSRKAIGGTAPYDMVRKMRASYYLIGAELGRFGRAYVGLPGGCDFGVRPIDQHIKGLEALGAEVTVESGYIEAEVKDALTGSHIYFDGVTVGATMNIMIAAVKAKGLTVIENAAREPHIVDLANFLNACGAQITGAGTDVIKIKGVSKLHGCTHAIISDMIEAGTFMIAAAATGGALKINNVIPKHLESISAKLTEMGISVEEHDDYVIVSCPNRMLSKVNVKTMPYPGFPTDIQSPFMALLTTVEGSSVVIENIFENRFMHVAELNRMGANIKIDGRSAIIYGGRPLQGAQVISTDLRAGAAMVLAGLVAEGTTEIAEIYHIERGYENFVEKFRKLGATIIRIDD